MSRFKWYRRLRGGYWVNDICGWRKVSFFGFRAFEKINKNLMPRSKRYTDLFDTEDYT